MIQKGPYGEEIEFCKKLSKKLKAEKNTYWFVDSYFKNHAYFKNMNNLTFLNAGEDLKSLTSLEKNLKTLVKNKMNRSSKIYCVGGGSLGDSIGFLCSIYMRGLDFVMIPTTWLSCVDSAVGAKTALNHSGYKNLIGSFYPPKKIILAKELIESSSQIDAEGEIFKTLILNHKKRWSKEISKNWQKDKICFDDLKKFVSYKTQIVKKDTRDLVGIRAVLNFGHSIGHALELEKGLTHGEAVKQGSLFSLRWSLKKGFLDKKTFSYYESLLNCGLSKISETKLKQALLTDKKGLSKDKMKFVFLSDDGPRVENVSIASVVKEYKRQV